MGKMVDLEMFGKRYYITVVVIVLLTELVIVSAAWMLGLETDPKIGIVAFTATPLFIVTLMELGRNLRLQRAAFIKDYISQFFTNPDLYQTFHELIYSYPNSLFTKLNKIKEEQGLDKWERPVFKPFAELQGERAVGSRLYHPHLFQGSHEERKLDALLGYFDVIAYYYAKGYLRIEDISGSVGYFLGVMRAREVVSNYMDLNEQAWKLPEYKSMGVTPPFSYLRRLLDDLDQYNARFERRIKKLQKQRI